MPKKKKITNKVLFTKTIQWLQPHFHLDDWKILIKYSSKMENAADCEAVPEYKEAIIRLNTSQVNHITPYDVVSMAIHEMIHCIVWDLAEWATIMADGDTSKTKMVGKLEETVVTRVEKILTTWMLQYIKECLISEGYEEISLEFDNVIVMPN